MRNLKHITLCCLLFAIVYGCSKNETDFRDFLGDKEIIYPGAVTEVLNQPGNGRVKLKWKSSSDPNIVKYVVYWNNKADSQVVDIDKRTDSIEMIIPGLREFVYSFTIYSFDAKRNRSIAKEVNNVKVYGSVYQGTLLNRAFNAEIPYLSYTAESVKLDFLSPDTINIGTLIRYENRSGQMVDKTLKPTENIIELTDYKMGTQIKYRSSYIPERAAIDVFTVNEFSTYPLYIFKNVQCDKALFSALALPNDAYAAYDTSFGKLWDNSNGPQSYPNLFHSNEDYIPHVFTLDMGKTYNSISQIEETGRNCCHNPTKFEVWGINSLTNATTILRADNAGWKDEAIAKGWVLLKEVTRSDDGSNALKIALRDNPPPVRYIRIRVLQTATGNKGSNISELTFWNLQ